MVIMQPKRCQSKLWKLSTKWAGKASPLTGRKKGKN